MEREREELRWGGTVRERCGGCCQRPASLLHDLMRSPGTEKIRKSVGST